VELFLPFLVGVVTCGVAVVVDVVCDVVAGSGAAYICLGLQLAFTKHLFNCK